MASDQPTQGDKAPAPEVSAGATAAEPGRERRAPPPAPAPPEPAEAPGTIEKGAVLGRYLILDKLGEGGMGVVYAAYDPQLDRKIALKILSARFSSASGSSARARLQREAQAMARVSHPNVITVHDVGLVDGQIFVAMELVDGGTLNRWFKDTQRAPREILHAFVDAGRGLAAAHAAGLVHRDFKPDNVLISRDGRVRVTDFGLARLVGSGPEDDRITVDERPPASASDESGKMLETPLTLAGSVMGTPAYMSPEQHLGQVPDARSDQFSFCAALYWALYRKRPFDPKVLAAVAGRALGDGDAGTRIERAAPVKERPTAPGKGIVQEPPKEPKVPKRVKRALMRGLAIDPDQRFESMEALLSELTPPQRVVQRRYVIAATAALVAGVLLLSVLTVRDRQQLCSGADRRLAGTWDGPARAALVQAFGAVGQPWAAAAALKVGERFDLYAGEWAAMHRDACEATRIRGEQTEQVLELRMLCLDRRLNELQALTSVIRRDPGVLEKALDAAYQLSPVKGCADVAALMAPVPRPRDAITRAKVESIERQLAEAKAQLDSGKHKAALEVAQPAAAEALTVEFAPVKAEALHLLGWLEVRNGQAAEGEQTLKRALWAAEAGRQDSERLRIANKLVWTLGESLRRVDDATEYVELARALLARTGSPPELTMELWAYEGTVLLGQGRYDDAIARYRQAIELADAVLPPEHPRRHSFRANLSAIHSRRGDTAEAIRLGEDALEHLERSRGPDHPTVATTHYNLAIARRDSGEHAAAHEHIERCIEIRRAAQGEDSRFVAEALEIRATIFQRERRYAEALADSQRSLEIRRRTLGPEHVDISYSYENLGQAQLGLGNPAAAVEALERAVALRERNRQEDSELAEPRFALARAVMAQHRDRKRARTLATLARDGYAKAGNLQLATEVATWLQANP